MKKLLAPMLIAFLAGSIGLAREASADMLFGYPCYVYLVPGKTMGQGGGIQLHLYSGPACTGTRVAAPIFCTEGSYTQACDLEYVYGSVALAALAQMLQQAVFEHSYLTVFTKNGCPMCGQVVYFYQ